MKITELREKSITDLNRLLKEKQNMICQLRFNLISGKVKNVREVRQTRKDIAKILTVLKKNQ